MKILIIPLIVILLVDLVFPSLLSFKYPNYSHLHHTISTLSTETSPVRLFAAAALIVSGITFLVYCYLLSGYFEARSWSHNLYLSGLIAFGIGSIIAGIFPEDPRGAAETLNGKLHGIASGIGFLLLMFSLLWAVFIHELSGYALYHLLFFGFSVTSFGLFLGSINHENGWLSYTGLYQRANITILYLALIFHASILIKSD
jgi:hypothetical protein